MNKMNISIASVRWNDRISIVGLILIVLLILVTTSNIEISLLTKLQQDYIYKQLTGFLLSGFILYQWYFAFARQLEPAQAKQKLQRHKIVGLLMPVLLFIHSTQTGHAYQAFIWAVFIIHCSVGFLNPEFMGLKKRRLRLFWFIAHISLSVMVSGLLVFHLYIVYSYS